MFEGGTGRIVMGLGGIDRCLSVLPRPSRWSSRETYLTGEFLCLVAFVRLALGFWAHK